MKRNCNYLLRKLPTGEFHVTVVRSRLEWDVSYAPSTLLPQYCPPLVYYWDYWRQPKYVTRDYYSLIGLDIRWSMKSIFNRWLHSFDFLLMLHEDFGRYNDWLPSSIRRVKTGFCLCPNKQKMLGFSWYGENINRWCFGILDDGSGFGLDFISHYMFLAWWAIRLEDVLGSQSRN